MKDNKLLEYEKLLKEIDTFIYESYKKIDIYSYLTPVNLVEENNKFLEKFKKGIEYNPIYQYKIIDKTLEHSILLDKIFKYKKSLEKSLTNSTNILNILAEKEIDMLNDLENIINLYNHIGIKDENIDIYSKKIYGYPEQNLIQMAKNILESKIIVNDDLVYTAEDCEKTFKKVLNQLNLDWKIKINEVQSSKISVFSEDKLILINKNAKFSKNDLKRLVVHEIGTHVLRSNNGHKQPYKIFSLDNGKTLFTEEGLATVNEEDCGVLDNKTLRIYAGRVLAINECMTKSFYNVFKTMLKYFTSDDALYIVSRVKRGITNTANFNVFVKDYVYLYGYYKVKKYLEKNNKMDLYVGIIGIDEVDKINKLIASNILNKFEDFDFNKFNIND